MASKLDFSQKGFSGGMNLLFEPTRIGENEYVLGRNVRNRKDTLEPVRNHEIIPTPTVIAPAEGVLQGIYAFGEKVLLFQDGEAYWAVYGEWEWTQVADFSMSANADIIYVCAVPVSTMKFGRQLSDANHVDGDINLVSSIVDSEGTTAGLVCQDGTSQPWIIYESGDDLLARELNTYAEWDDTDPDDREYVPIGTKMVFSNGILYVVSQLETEIYRSVTNRPLDFVVNIATDGSKGGDATTTSYAVSNSPITCIQQLNTESLFVATRDQHCYAVTPTRDETLFGEPTFNRTYLFKAGCLNQFSFVDILGDFGFIDSEGLRSFNAVLQQNNEGRNSVFSQKIAAAFANINQSASQCAAVVFDNYAMFNVLTRYGRVNIVYDTLYQTFVSFDSFQYGPIKQFAVVDGDSRKRLLAITTNNSLISCFTGIGHAQALVETREWTSGDPSIELDTQHLRAVFLNTTVEGEATSVVYIDGSGRPNSHMGVSKRLIPAGQSGLLYVVTYPALWGTDRTMVNLIFNHNGGKGFKVGYTLRWNNGAVLTHLMSQNFSVTPRQAPSSKVTQYAS